MTERQRGMLFDVVSESAGIINQSAGADRMMQLKAELNDTWFAWSGPTDATPGSNITAYYRIQGPHLVIEYAPQTLGGDPALHVHTMYRDPTNDYGRGMIKKMKLRLITFVAFVLCLARVAYAHKLDEYLQAAMISVQKDHVQVSMRLIPGVAVSSAVIARIDSDGDGVLSEAEQHSYADRALPNWSLKLDGVSLHPVLDSMRFPEIGQIREGLGEIQLEATADLPRGGSNRRLTLENLHPDTKEVYLVNCLAPEDEAIRIASECAAQSSRGVQPWVGSRSGWRA